MQKANFGSKESLLKMVYRITYDKPKMKNFVIFTHEVLTNLLFNNELTYRHTKTLILIIWLSIGCRKAYAVIKKADLKVINIYSSDARDILNYLHYNKWIYWVKESDLVFITPKLIHNSEFENEIWSSLLQKNVNSAQKHVETTLGKLRKELDRQEDSASEIY